MKVKRVKGEARDQEITSRVGLVWEDSYGDLWMTVGANYREAATHLVRISSREDQRIMYGDHAGFMVPLGGAEAPKKGRLLYARDEPHLVLGDPT